MNKFIIFFLLGILLSGCGQKQYQVFSRTGKEKIKDEKSIIDITCLFEKYTNASIQEFSKGDWLIAVHSFKTGYTYFYDENNTFLGRRKE